MEMSNLLERTNAWLEHINSAENILLPQTIFMRPGALAMLESDSLIENPANSEAVGDYRAQAEKASTPGTAPQSVFDGMQTAVNMCRTKAQYNPLDPEGKGNRARFIEFTQNISSMPFVTLEWATTTQIKQKSRNADVLINSFVDGFWGITQGDKEQIVKSVRNLASAALSYADQTERLSNFAQNLLQVDSSGNVEFCLYSSTFQISVSEHKGIITFHSEYELSQAMYSLSPSNWDSVKELFAKEYKVTVEDWIKNMTTPVKEGSTIRALCLEDR
eukprot:NODE_1615_length_1662_cov_3.222222_g1536_i0.p1 GENE.NODE_1615_length_1662_cov_3.222222_g1536_i0~~NODE_1615_length_1662_cov_3.222222_g1536_i0.p1  ORF type:complete len:275 (-),score=-22.70 NODE_1615_length_1662_cov_3.222222_g1536_i0:34-858(-)